MPVTINGTGTIDLGANLKLSNDLTSDANTLDDYEEGTWTPVFCKAGSGETMYVNNGLTIFHADYLKIGKYVYVSCYIQNDTSFNYASGRSSGESLGLKGLPFTVSNSPTNSGSHPIYVGYFASWTGWSASYTPMGYFDAGSDRISFVYATTNTVTNVTATFLYSSSSAIILSGWYRT